jgi:predicted DCC family thiol-disulfide oxidoreductase YuxK
MAVMPERPSYSYRDDPSVPAFDDGGPIAFMDGNCLLCASGARAISRFDRRREFRICPLQTPLGSAVAAHYGLVPGDPETWLYLVDGRAYSSMDAMIRIGQRLGGAGRAMAALRLLPRPAQDWIYRRIARNRYRLGRTDICALPDPALRARLMT